MKGFEKFVSDMLFALIVIFATVTLVVYFSNPVSGLINEATRLQSKYWTYQIAGIISLTESAEDGISTTLDLPSAPMKIGISQISVSVQFDPQNKYVHYFTETNPPRTKLELIDYVNSEKLGQIVDIIELDSTKHEKIIIQKINDRILIKAVSR